MQDTMKLEVVRLFRFNGDSKIKAFADVAIGDFVVKGLRLVEGENGLFLGLPQEKSPKDGKWYNSFYARNKEAHQQLMDVVMSAYEEG